MRYRWTCLCLLTVSLAARADVPPLQEARQRWLRGNYEEARARYESLARDATLRSPATVGLSRTWQSQGDYDQALAVVEAALRDLPEDAALLARRAEVLYLRGRWDQALDAAEKALALQENLFPARWVRAQVLRDRGDLKEAEAECRWFVRTYSGRSEKDDDIKDADQLLLVGLAGAENARVNSLADQFPFILNEVYGDALRYDKDFWQAEYQAGLLLLEKYNRGEALTAFDKALAINPNAAEALVGKGVAALQKYEIKDAEDFAQRALRINPNLPEARRLRADVYLAGGEVAAALKDLDRARQVNPRDETTLGRVAACLFLKHQQTELDRLAEEVARHDPKSGVFYFTLAEQLDERRHFDAAEKYYQKAIELRPALPAARNGLGLLYMRMGREAEARDILTKAFAADAYNVRVSNMLKVLRHLDRYETLKTEHFQVRFDPHQDRQLARYMAGYLEAIYADLAGKYRYQPTGPILVEVFNNHDFFSGRVTALPDLHTIGACTGRMVALVSPHGKGIGKPFNWARVLRHELVHIFNLEQTHFQVPHWFTEGLAVQNEGFPRPPQWDQLLLERVPAGNVMTLDTINLGFIRPRSPLDWHQAYCQSDLYISYVKEKYGPDKIGALLQAFAGGLDAGDAVKRACGVDKEAFEKGYREYLEGVVRSLGGKPAAKAKTLTQLQKAHAAEPNNSEVAALLAEQYLLRRRTSEAKKLVDDVLAKDGKHALAGYVKARLLQAAGEDDEARKLLESVLDPAAPEPKVCQVLGRLAFEAGDYPSAVRVYELARRAQPYESKWLAELLRVYTQAGNRDKQIETLKELVPTDADDLAQRKRLARLLLDAGRAAEAEPYARQALEIDVLDGEARSLLLEALKSQKKDAEAQRVAKLLEAEAPAEKARQP